MKNLCLKVLLIFFVSVTPAYTADSNIELSDEAIGLQLQDIPGRPKLPVEIANPLLGIGEIREGFTLPSQAVWQPSFYLFGEYRTAVQSVYNGNDHISEWANRFDLFGNLALTQTERFLIGIRFLDKDGDFTGYTFKAPPSVRSEESGYDDAVNAKITHLFFEGDFGELFPFLDPRDRFGLDFGLAIGRQPIRFQDGILIDDNLDAIGISKINLRPGKIVNLRSSFVWAMNEINRTNLTNDEDDATLYGLFNEIDLRPTTLEFDIIYIEGGDQTGDGIYTGLGAIQRFGRLNTTFRILNSQALSEETIHNSDGLLLFGELSLSPKGTHNHLYLNGFRGFDQFRSASRDTLAGGPLARTGILYEAVGLGRYASPLDNTADDAYGGALGYQLFFNETRQNLTLELGGRYGMDEDSQRAIGAGARFQTAIGQRSILQFDGYALHDEERTIDTTPADDQIRFGGRVEYSLQF